MTENFWEDFWQTPSGHIIQAAQWEWLPPPGIPNVSYYTPWTAPESVLTQLEDFSNIIGSAEALPILCVRYFRWERKRERERYRDRRKWRHHCRAKIGDEFTLFPCQKFAQMATSLHFPLPKIRTFRFSLHTSRLSLLKWSSLWRWNSQWVNTSVAKRLLPLCSESLKWREPRDE